MIFVPSDWIVAALCAVVLVACFYATYLACRSALRTIDGQYQRAVREWS